MGKEPFQRGSGAEPLTVATHVEDLHELINVELTRISALEPGTITPEEGMPRRRGSSVREPDHGLPTPVARVNTCCQFPLCLCQTSVKL